MALEVSCPYCQSQNVEPTGREWKIKGRVQGKTKTESDPKKHNVILVRIYQCLDCNKKFRKGIPQK